MIRALLGLVGKLLNIYKLLIVVYIVLEILNVPANRWTELLRSVIEPVLAPVRRLVNKYLPDSWKKLDWSPVALFLILTVVQWLL